MAHGLSAPGAGRRVKGRTEGAVPTNRFGAVAAATMAGSLQGSATFAPTPTFLASTSIFWQWQVCSKFTYVDIQGKHNRSWLAVLEGGIHRCYRMKRCT